MQQLSVVSEAKIGSAGLLLGFDSGGLKLVSRKLFDGRKIKRSLAFLG
jgi:hypothetical protein